MILSGYVLLLTVILPGSNCADTGGESSLIAPSHAINAIMHTAVSRPGHHTALPEFGKSGLLIGILLVVIILCIISMFILLAVIFLNRNHMERKERLRQVLKERYQNLLMDYLFDEEEHSPAIGKIRKIAATGFKREILAGEMKDLMVNLSGNPAKRLHDLFHSLGLEKDVIRKVKNKKWHIRIKGFRELAFMNLRIANDEVMRCMQSSNSILRMEAQLALVCLNGEDRFSFLGRLQRPFTRWEQINVHEMIINHELEVPDFQKWLDSPNPSVVIFSLDMIKVFRQDHALEKVIGRLDHVHAGVRKTAISVLGHLGNPGAIPALKNRYRLEEHENQVAILIALNRISDGSSLRFLLMVIDKEDDVRLQIEAARAVRDLGEKGEAALRKLMESDYKNYLIIIKHVLDKRI